MHLEVTAQCITQVHQVQASAALVELYLYLFAWKRF